MGLRENMETWDKGEDVMSAFEQAIKRTKSGECFSEDTVNLLKNCSVCPVGNTSCLEYFEILIHSITFYGETEIEGVRICPLGLNKETCLLNK